MFPKLANRAPTCMSVRIHNHVTVAFWASGDSRGTPASTSLVAQTILARLLASILVDARMYISRCCTFPDLCITHPQLDSQVPRGSATNKVVFYCGIPNMSRRRMASRFFV